MYHLLVKFEGWADERDTLMSERVFEPTFSDQALSPRAADELLALDRLPSGPALFATEDGGSGPAVARLGVIRSARATGRRVEIEYEFDGAIAPIPIASVAGLRRELSIEPYELGHTHWALKNVDLLRVLLLDKARLGPRPTVFKADDPVESDLVSVMMPFDASFAAVHAAIRDAVEGMGMRCLRADDIWEHDAIIQDIVSLISRSRIVIADCSGRNPNVFYEIGIAHSLGRDVILITRSGDDIPFDLRHLRYASYLNNGEGRVALVGDIRDRIATLTSRSAAR